MKNFLNNNSKYIIVAVAVIVVAFILKPERSAFNDCYYENKKREINDLNEMPADASFDAIDRCR